jgi:predicted permease
MLRPLLDYLLRRSRKETELDEEVRMHLSMERQRRIDAGESPEAAQAGALKDFGNVAMVKEATRETWGRSWRDGLSQDVRHGWRILRKHPGFAFAAIVSIGLGIGVNGALMSVVDALLLRNLPVKDAEQLVMLKRMEANGRTMYDLPYPVFERLRDQPDVFASVTANWPIERTGEDRDGVGSEGLRVGMAAGNYFSTLRVDAVVGRVFTEADNRVPAAHPVAVISHRYWVRRFDSRADAVGYQVRIAGRAFTVIGVAQRGFSGEWAGRPIDIWVPFMMASQVMPEVPAGPARFPALVLARLKPDVGRSQAEAALQLRYANTLRDMAGGTPPSSERRIALESAAAGYSAQRATLAQPLRILAMLASLGLLAVCASLANLLLARTESRERELAVRQALGAGRPRIVRQLLTEGLLLGLLGGFTGLLLVYGSTGPLAHALAATPLAPGVEEHSLLLDIRVDWRVIAFGLALSVLISAVFGLVATWRISGTAVANPLKERFAAATGRGLFSLGKSLVILQVAITVVLVMTAGLLLRSLHKLQEQEIGFESRRLLLVWAAPARAGRTVPILAGLAQRVEDRLSALPGVESVSVSSGGVLDGGVNGGRSEALLFEGKEPKPGLMVNSLAVSPGFFSTVGIPILRGRAIQARDAQGAPPVAVISETMARFFFGNEDPIGKRFSPAGEQGYAIEIVGVAKDAKLGTPRDRRGAWYFPYHQNPRYLRLNWCIALRVHSSPESAIASVTNALRDVESGLAVLRANTVGEQLNHVLGKERLTSGLAMLFCFLALLLTCIGLYGLISLRIVRRTSEIGVRFALGATRASVLRLVVGEGVLLVSIGVVLGVPMAFALSDWLSSWLFGIDRADPMTLVATALMMLVVTLAAAVVPAFRASRIDPINALRAE